MKVQLHADGSWEIIGAYFSLKGLYPSIDGHAIRPVQVSIQGDTMVYELEKGRMTLCAGQEQDRIRISCSMQGLPGVHDIEPIGSGKICRTCSGEKDKAPLQVFVQGFGMEGPSGCYRIDDTRRESNGLTAICEDEQILLLYALDHTRYINRYFVESRESVFHQKEVVLACGFDLEGTGTDEISLPAAYIEEHQSSSLEDVLRKCASQIAESMHARNVQPPAYHWCSWYYHYQNLNQKILEEYMEKFPAVDPHLRYIQIDAGYCPSLGDWLLPNHLFPEGLEKAAQTILRAGYQPGIWIGVFMVGDHSQVYREHPDWVLHDLQGKPVTKLQSYNEPKAWGNPDGDYYVLDTSHPEAMEYLRTVFRTLYRWGFRLYKTDFMLWNMLDSSQVKRYDPSKTSVEILRSTLQMIREEIGEESYFLGCIAPFLPFIGYADGMRIAGDVGAQWEGAYGPVNMLRELAADNYFQNLYWQNDPDSVLLRDFEIFLKPQEMESLALVQALSGGVLTTSDPLHLLPEQRQKLWNFIKPSGKVKPTFPYLGKEREELVITHTLKQGNLLYVMNPTDRPLGSFYNLNELFDKDTWYAYQWKKELPGEKQSMLAVRLQPHECALFFLTQEPLEKIPENIWNW